MTVTSGEPPADAPEREHEDGRSTIRLFVEDSLESGATLALGPGQAHYLRNVMRQAPGDRIRLFNGRDGEWEGIIESIAPRRAAVRLATRTAGASARARRAAPLRAAQGDPHPVRGGEGDGAGRAGRHPPGPHPAWPDHARQRRATPRPRHRGGRAVRPPGRTDDRTPPARLRTRSPAGRRNAGCWYATPRRSGRSPRRWPTRRQHPGQS